MRRRSSAICSNKSGHCCTLMMSVVTLFRIVRWAYQVQITRGYVHTCLLSARPKAHFKNMTFYIWFTAIDALSVNSFEQG